jgi:hypothetical protein
MILHLPGSYPKNAILSDFSVVVSIPKLLSEFCNVSTALCKLFSESAIMTYRLQKRRVYCLLLFVKLMRFV